MKLLFDEQLSPRLVALLADLFPGSAHVHELGLGSADDRTVFEHARQHDFGIVTKDSDFADLALAEVSSAKVVWVRLGNCPTERVAQLLRDSAEALLAFAADPAVAVMALTE